MESCNAEFNRMMYCVKTASNYHYVELEIRILYAVHCEHRTNFLMGPLEEQTNLQSHGCVPQLEICLWI